MLGKVLGGLGLLTLLALSLAAWPSAVLDRGPDGLVRVSAFPMALAVFDPFVWTCVRNSVLVASATTLLSTLIGVGLDSIAGGGRFWGRGLLWPLVIVPMAAGPVLIAPGLDLIIGGPTGSGWAWLSSRSALGISAEALVRWLALVGTGLAVGVPWVGLATRAGLRKLDPAWIEAAMAVGASRRRAWLDVVWPNLRPGVARASALVFTLSLVEPAGPLVLGLGRTLAVQLVRAATRLDQPTRASILAILTMAIALLARGLILRWGGTDRSRFDRSESGTLTTLSPGRASLANFALAAWAGLAVGPVGYWLWQSIRSPRDNRPGSLSQWLVDPEWLGWLANSALTAGLAVAINLAILGALRPSKPDRGGRRVGLAARFFEALPPLALGASALAVPWLVLAMADSLAIEGPMTRGLRRLALELRPGRSPGFLLILVLAASQWPMLAEAARRTRSLIRPVRVDASRLMGESDGRAARLGGAGWWGVVPIDSAFLAFAMAATSLAPALLLTPYSERRTLAPAMLKIVLEAGPIDPQSLAPVAILLGLNLLAFGIASRGRYGIV